MTEKSEVIEWQIVDLKINNFQQTIFHPFTQYRIIIARKVDELTLAAPISFSLNFTIILYLFVYFNVCKVEDLIGKTFTTSDQYGKAVEAFNSLIAELQTNIRRKE